MNYRELTKLYEKLESTTKRLEKTYYIAELLKKASEEDLETAMLLIKGNVFPKWDQRKVGVASRLVLKALNLATGIPQSDIEKLWKQTGDLGNVAERITHKKSQATLFQADLTIKKVYDNLRLLASTEGQGAVDRKIKLIAELLTSATPLEAKYIIRTVLEDLRVGVGEGSIRDAIVWAFLYHDVNYDEKEKSITLTDEQRKDYNKMVEIVQEAYDLTNEISKVAVIAKTKGIRGLKNLSLEIGKPLNVMLYQKAKDIEEAFERCGRPAALEYKYDGFRCITGYTSLYIKGKGFISVRDVKKNDYALTHKGNFKKIIAINKRTIDTKERLFEIQSFYGNKFKVSEKHPILVYKNKPCWVNIENLTKKDKLIFPIPKLNSRFPYKDKLVLKDESGYYKEVKINNFFFRFLGYWIGDGFTNNYHNTERIGLIFNHKKDKKLVKYYERNIKKFFRIRNISKNIHGGAIYLYWRDKPFRKWLTLYFRREWKGKTLPEWFNGISKIQFEEFIKGWIESDGYIDKYNRIIIHTKEKDLAMFVSLLGLKFKKLIGVKKIRIDNKTYYRLILPKSNRCYEFKKNFLLINILRIKEIKNPDPRTLLYNLQIESDESYCTSMVCLHNCQIHRNKEKIWIFTRRLENVTNQFPDVVKILKENIKSDNFILDAEVIGIDPKTKKWLAFQNISQRIKRKYDIEKMAKDIPVMVNIFDTIQINGENLIKVSFKERRKKIEEITEEIPEKLSVAKQLITDNEKEAEEFYNESLKLGNEGIMVKNLEAPYKPGSRVGYGVKVKPVMETLDLVIVGAEWGKGKRASWLSSFTIACIDENDEFREIGKVGTGIKEKEEDGVTFHQLTEMLKPLIISEKGKEAKVKPEIVIEINYEEIQKSPTYSSGYALRFPRLISIREDRSPKDISTLEQVEELFYGQK